MTIYADVDSVPRQCGGRFISGFRIFSNGGTDVYSLETIKEGYAGKMLIATFNQHQKKMYEACCKTFTWLGQSKPIRNPSSGNYIFTAVFKA